MTRRPFFEACALLLAVGALRGFAGFPTGPSRSVGRPCTASWRAVQSFGESSRFVTGQTFRYRLYTRWLAETQRSGLAQDSPVPFQTRTTLRAVMRFEVLSAAAGGPVRLRATFDSATASVRDEMADLRADQFEESFHQLEGRSFEFAIEPGGKIGIPGILPRAFSSGQAAPVRREWLENLFAAAAIPPGAVAGKVWSSEEPLQDSPLAGFIARDTHRILRQGPCRVPGVPTGDAPESALPRENCMVIQAQTEILRAATAADSTPEEYRRRNLRTTGTWNGTGQSLSYVSLKSGLLVSQASNREESLEFTVAAVSGEATLKYSGRARMETQITLLLEPRAK